MYSCIYTLIKLFQASWSDCFTKAILCLPRKTPIPRDGYLSEMCSIIRLFNTLKFNWSYKFEFYKRSDENTQILTFVDHVNTMIKLLHASWTSCSAKAISCPPWKTPIPRDYIIIRVMLQHYNFIITLKLNSSYKFEYNKIVKSCEMSILKQNRR